MLHRVHWYIFVGVSNSRCAFVFRVKLSTCEHFSNSLTLKIRTLRIFETPLTIYQQTLRNTPEDLHLQQNPYENFKYRNFYRITSESYVYWHLMGLESHKNETNDRYFACRSVKPINLLKHGHKYKYHLVYCILSKERIYEFQYDSHSPQWLFP